MNEIEMEFNISLTDMEQKTTNLVGTHEKDWHR